jgi:hypothetical protein
VKYTNLETDLETARRIGKHLFEPVRVFGIGRWLREEDGTWTLRRFKVRDFTVADSDEAGHAFQSEAGHLFRSDAGRGSDLMSATERRRYGSMDDRFCWLFGQADGSV